MSFSQEVKFELEKRIIGKNSAEIELGKTLARVKNYGEIAPETFSAALICGIFLACGSVADPNAEYHLEMPLKSADLAKSLCNALIGLGVLARTGAGTRVYIKDSESIADFLTMIGSPKAGIALMEAKMVKGLRERVNRKVNCEAANLDKTVRAAESQIRDIERIYDNGNTLSEHPELKAVADLRLNNPDMSLRDISQICGISRSGVFHRFAKLAEIARNL